MLGAPHGRLASWKTMDEQPPIRITADDIAEANQLSLHCPICASGVENNPTDGALAPVVCAKCQTLYHAACWGQNGSKCAILGCGHDRSYPYGNDVKPLLKIEHRDLPRDVPRPPITPNGRNKQLKEQERRLQKEMKRRGFLSDLFQSLLRAIRIWR
jgi:hypothetical protein